MRTAPRTTSVAARGFTLIEVLVSVVILSVGLVLVLRAMNTSLFGLDGARASLLAQVMTHQRLTHAELSRAEGDSDFPGPAPVPPDGWAVEESLSDEAISGAEATGSNVLTRVVTTALRQDNGRTYDVETFVYMAR